MNAPATFATPTADELIAVARTQHSAAMHYEAKARINNSVMARYDLEDADVAYGRRNAALRELRGMGETIPGFSPFDAKALHAFLTQE